MKPRSIHQNCAGRFTSYGLEPGDYTIVFIAKNRPTGTLMVLPYDAKEVRSQEDTLKEKLDDMRVSQEDGSNK